MKNERTTLCYIEKDGAYLMLHRTKKKNDINAGKWIGVGGHIEEGETPEECIRRETTEETGLVLGTLSHRGIIHFSCGESREEMYVYTSDSFSGDLLPCPEGELEWIKKDRLLSLPLWEGDRVFLPLLIDGAGFFELTLEYSADGRLVSSVFA